MAWSLVIPEEVACSCEVGEGASHRAREDADRRQRRRSERLTRWGAVTDLSVGLRHAARGTRHAAGGLRQDPTHRPTRGATYTTCGATGVEENLARRGRS